MPSGKSVTYWIHQLKEGERAAVPKLWQSYFARLLCDVRRRLRHTSVHADEAEDIALSAFKSFCLRAEQGRFPKLFDRGDLWQLLMVIAYRKTCNQIKRSIRHTKQINFSELPTNGDDDSDWILIEMISQEPDPQTVLEVTESCRHLLELLPTAELRDIAVWKMEGYTNEEIAAKMNDGKGRSVKAVERKLALIRKIWAKELPS